MRKVTKIKRDVYQEVTDKVLEMMETHGTNWTNPMTEKGWSFNGVTMQSYSGINVLLLGSVGGGAFASYKQWQSKGCQVMKNETGHQIIFFKKVVSADKVTGEESIYPMIKTYTVFSAHQVEGEYADQFKVPVEKKQELELNQDVQDWVANTGAVVKIKNEGRAFYNPNDDYIQIPPQSNFNATGSSSAAENYNSVLLHELAHWTGHKSRLDRSIKNMFGTKDYAFEELVAELASAFQCVKLGVTNEPRADHAQYLNCWIKVLREDKKAIVKAASLAQKAVDYLDSLQSKEAEEVA